MCHWCSYHILTSSVIYCIKAALFHERRAKVGPSPFWQTRKKAIWRHLWSIKNKAIPLVAVRWQRIVIGFGKSRHCQLDSLVASEARIELRNQQLLRKCWKSRVLFCHQISPMSRKAWMLPWILQELKNTLGKLPIAVNLGAIVFAFWTERSVSDGGNLCSLWSVIRKSVWNSIGDTF